MTQTIIHAVRTMIRKTTILPLTTRVVTAFEVAAAAVGHTLPPEKRPDTPVQGTN